jgi:beta-lactam-binding protein with PASTA domain/tRNA A-37 threonylcarbamoyl transferase component Bud32
VAVSRVSDRVGQVLGGRYRLVAPIGTGASASVYLADDVTLRRRVAVKILHDALADDPAFLKRFRAEARSAAALNHPHVMAVYDWGHGDVPYLVTEYLGGGSLRGVLDLGRRLTTSQALLVGIETARGLSYAHRQGFVHRDIKPANLLFDEDGRLRIADFGLARALAEAAWTEPAGAVLGTARYASPEQARGEALDGRSDVYSLAVVLVEAVTGEVPFATDTALGTLMARVDRPLPVDAALGPLVPILTRAGSPVAAERPDAAELEAALMRAAPKLDRPEPLPLAGAARLEVVELDDRDPTTEYLAERAAVAPFEPEIMSAPPGTTSNGIAIVHEGEGQPETRQLVLPDGEGQVYDGGADDDEEPQGRRARRAARKAQRRQAKEVEAASVHEAAAVRQAATGGRRRRRWPWVVLAVLLVGGLAGAGGWYYWYNEVREVTNPVPELVDLPETDLAAALAEGGWSYQVIETPRVDGTTAGQVLAQEPAPGTELREGDVVAVVVSAGQTMRPVPGDLAELPFAEAEARLVEAGLVVGDVEKVADERVPADHVIAVGSDVPAELERGSPVALVVSSGPAPRTVPTDLVEKSRETAEDRLTRDGLVPEVTTRSSTSVDAGDVIEVPSAGQQVARGTTVEVVVSSGPPMVQVPITAGQTAVQASAALRQAGLTVAGVRGAPDGDVRGTDPAAGQSVPPGTRVTIITE